MPLSPSCGRSVTSGPAARIDAHEGADLPQPTLALFALPEPRSGGRELRAGLDERIRLDRLQPLRQLGDVRRRHDVRSTEIVKRAR